MADGPILILAGLAAMLIVIFGGDTHALIPLYAVGVFISFTLSQAGMVRHWLTDGGAGWRWRLGVNGVGALVTGAVTVVIAVTKFTHGAWIVVLLIPLLVLGFRAIHRHYDTAKSRRICRSGKSRISFSSTGKAGSSGSTQKTISYSG